MPTKKKRSIKRKKTRNGTYETRKATSYAPTKHVIKSKSICKSGYTIPERSDKDGLQRILSPFNKFAVKSTNKSDIKNKQVVFQSTYKSPGLSPKERSYVISSCQARASQYSKLKSLATNAMKENKIFSIYGNCNAVRKALLERGWVEKIPAYRMNLSKIRNGTLSSKTDINYELERLLLSNFVEKCNANFIWRTNDELTDSSHTIDMKKEYFTIVNKLKLDALWTSKQGLCSSMKRNYWFYIEDVAEVNGPRTYNTYNSGEIEGFVKDYKITACTSLLKWVLSMVAHKKPVFVDKGRISIKIIVFALNRCKEYLFRKQNMDIDGNISTPSIGQWNAFLKKYYRIIAKEEVFEKDKNNKLLLYLTYAKALLKEIRKYRPQVSCEGCHNIWIIKPAHCSRGRGIRMASKLGVITDVLTKANAKYVIQKYVEEPVLIYNTKFDIRQYYLVTSTYPLVIWMYQECYLKFSSQHYNLKNYHESIHLTNNAVQRRYQNCEGRHPDLPENNMWDLETFKNYLNKLGIGNLWDNVIYPGMRKSIVSIMLNCQDSLSVSKNRFELYGCDFILDKEYKPWLIEINSCPDLNHTTRVTARICPAVVSDIIKVVIDYAANPESSTGKFECIYQQPMTIPKYALATEMCARGYSLPLDYFYTGRMVIEESYEDASISQTKDIKAILNKLKRQYDANVTEVPGSRDLNKRMNRETTYHAKYEQVDDLIDTMTSEDSSCSKYADERDLIPRYASDYKIPRVKQSTKSVTDIKSLLLKSETRQTFSFSKLDDGPYGKASCLGLFNQIHNFVFGH